MTINRARLNAALTLGAMLIMASSVRASSHHPQDFLHRIHGAPNEGSAIVEHFCNACHANPPLIPLDAPRIGVPADWRPRLSHGFVLLFQHVRDGFHAMPARGGCFECSDEQLSLALAAMLPKTKPTFPRVKSVISFKAP